VNWQPAIFCRGDPYQNLLASNIRGLKEAGYRISLCNQKHILEKISEHISKTSELVEKMIQARKNVIISQIQGHAPLPIAAR
jgi:hypothetical protein